MSRAPLPRVLTIAGSDSGGGAGIQADLKTFASWRVYGMSALTAVTAQNTVTVLAVEPLSAEMVGLQLDAVHEDLGIDAVKVGMLGEVAVARRVAGFLRELGGAVPVVVDPVMVAKSGAHLLAADARAVLLEEVLPAATLVTPNLPEAEDLLGRSLPDVDARRSGARELADRLGCAVLLKGGHGTGSWVFDLLCDAAGEEEFRQVRIDSTATHGTGCTLSSAIACALAWGRPLRTAVEQGIEYTRRAILAAPGLGKGHGPLQHLVAAPVRDEEAVGG